MLQPIITPTTTTPVPNAAMIAPRPVQQEQQSSSVRNLTANPVRQTSESEEAGADSEEDRLQRIEGERQAGAFARSGRSNGRGELLDIIV